MEFSSTLSEFELDHQRCNVYEIRHHGVSHEIRLNGLIHNATVSGKKYLITSRWFHSTKLGITYIWMHKDDKFIDLSSDEFDPEKHFEDLQNTEGTVFMLTQDLGSPEDARCSDAYNTLINSITGNQKRLSDYIDPNTIEW